MNDNGCDPGVRARKRGNGLVFQDKETGFTEKASNVGREFSLPRLEEKFGPYRAPTSEPEVEQIAAYERMPLIIGHKLSDVWKQYCKARKRKGPRTWRDYLRRSEGLDRGAIQILQEQEALVQGWKAGLYSGGAAENRPRYRKQGQDR
ncbi:hypothetical protein [Breoghania sp.]|uniref:hypothetical protein n=1 Tax=Breoghania sp. TaxID=2065378 RepID=UPI002AAB4160|nr:hypothetical protein [Breoghania sp.]